MGFLRVYIRLEKYPVAPNYERKTSKSKLKNIYLNVYKTTFVNLINH